MIERFHRQLKVALIARSDPSRWSDELLLVLLGVRSAVKENLGCSSAEMVFGTTWLASNHSGPVDINWPKSLPMADDAADAEGYVPDLSFVSGQESLALPTLVTWTVPIPSTSGIVIFVKFKYGTVDSLSRYGSVVKPSEIEQVNLDKWNWTYCLLG
ncbi:unnamed protein product [Mesocestoides corti]|uniref:Integrase catalytic domain-containing protein n=1 Tax=Mesocestoides corti TaxID=53468 RepID=A0A158QVP8_MESCO|nr:unnamed protein product [Mesocestoides corti]